MNSLFYPYIDPITGLPIIDADIMASLDPNTPKNKKQHFQDSQMDFNQIGMQISMSMAGGEQYNNYSSTDEYSLNLSQAGNIDGKSLNTIIFKLYKIREL